LTVRDQVKFVIADRADFEYAVAVMEKHQLAQCCEILLSPVHAKLPPETISRWILDAALPARLQLQLHKVIWGPETRR
ncbi:MAG: 7-carboxy-7-deazaguanine synthase QueE, partial [Vicinamibacteria bacterium]